MLGEDFIINQQKVIAQQIAKSFKVPTNSITKAEKYFTIKGKKVKINSND